MKMSRTMMKITEAANVNPHDVRELKRLVAEGEGVQLEFKRKAAYPEKIVRELIALANTDGGTLLIGVDDDGTIPGVKYPDEEGHVVSEALKKYCKPLLLYKESIIAISENKYVVRFDIPPSAKRPHFLILDKSTRQSFVREKDMSIKASPEMEEIVRRSKNRRDIRFSFGDAEKKLMEYLNEHHSISLPAYQKLSGLNRFKARRKLILLVLASVLKITATEKGDSYSRV
jgi:predicted HTH transcriptional regulator